ncbi:response regulator [Azospirillum sp. RWY-5-1]|uniref:Response regulator n=1 Tax=Azospirillum oleiclasticum TaxID=2735135 RepID=A0ABX2TCF7_9PROT|nr:response regulator [Azospirillum oleiclasticum]NYZ12937.1 response regulator [Azospirillum oleiclasticum]NYZ20390.1 response regulator [Azospirillum oleiclasticum]
MFDIEAQVRVPDGGPRRAVVADGDHGQRARIAGHLAACGFLVSEATDGYEALSMIGSEAPLVALIPRGDADDDGVRAAALANMLYPHTRIILTVSAPDGVDDDGPFLVLKRPVDLSMLDRCLSEIVAAAR